MRTRLAAALLLTVFLLAAGSALLAKDPEWVEGRSEHFHVVGNAKPQKVEEAARKLEEFRHVFASMFSRLRLDPPVPTTVIFFKDDKSFRAYKPLTPEGKPANVAGFFQPGHERLLICLAEAVIGQFFASTGQKTPDLILKCIWVNGLGEVSVAT